MVRRLLAAIMFVMIFCQPVFSQKEIEKRDQTWLAYFNQTRFTKRSGLWLDLHYRLTGDFVDERSVNIARLGYMYYVSDQVRVTAGYAYVKHFSHGPAAPDYNEHRPWQQIQWLDKKNGFSLIQYLRLEQRYRQTVAGGELTNNYLFNWRFRYNFSLTLPLKGKTLAAKTPFLFFSDELHIHAGKHIVNNYFDQNRLFLGLGYQFTSHLNAHLGYMYVFQQQPAGNQYIHINAIRLFISHNLDLRNHD
jgi:long-subunit fatty acid transport protein